MLMLYICVMFYSPSKEKSKELLCCYGDVLKNISLDSIRFNTDDYLIYKRVNQYAYGKKLNRLEFELCCIINSGCDSLRNLAFFAGFNYLKTRAVILSLIRRGWLETFKKETRFNYYRTSPKFLALLSDIDTYLIELRRLRQAAIDKRAEKEAKKRK